MSDEKKSNVPTNDDDQFDIVWIVSYLWARRWFIIKIVVAVVCLAVLRYAITPKTFTTKSSIVINSSSSLSSVSGLAGLASLVGVNVSSISSSGSINFTSDLYEFLLGSTPFALKIMNEPIPWVKPNDTIESLYSHIHRDTIPGLVGNILKYTVHLPHTIMSKINVVKPLPPATMSEDPISFEPLVINETQDMCIKWLSEHVSIEEDRQSGALEISAEGESPEQSAKLASVVLKHLRGTIIDIKTRDSKLNLSNAIERHNVIERKFDEARNAYYAYLDRHRDLVEERADITADKLKYDYNLFETLATTAAGEVETAQQTLLQETPEFSILEPIVQPIKKSRPKLLLHLVGGGLLGGILAVGGLLVYLAYLQAFKPSLYSEERKKYFHADSSNSIQSL